MSWRRIARAPAFPDRIVCGRIVLRPFRPGDADDLCSYANDEEWSRYITPPYPYRRASAAAFIDERINGHSNEWAGWCLDLQGQMIGSIDLILTPADKSGELAYSLGRKHWKSGLMTEALSSVIDAAFHIERPLNRLFVRIDRRNGASLRLIEKLGFQKEGVLRQSRLHKGEFVDDIVMALLRDDYMNRWQTRL